MKVVDNPQLRFATCVAAMASTWLVVLPHISRLEPIEQRLDWLDAKQIDASAMFYTELEAFTPLALPPAESKQPARSLRQSQRSTHKAGGLCLPRRMAEAVR